MATNYREGGGGGATKRKAGGGASEILPLHHQASRLDAYTKGGHTKFSHAE